MPDNGGSRRSYTYNPDDDGDDEIDYDYIAGLEKGSENYMSTDEACAEIFKKEGWTGVQKLLNELRAENEIDQNSFMRLFNKYRDM